MIIFAHVKSTYSILLIEDEEFLRENITEYLKLNHYQVETCANGREALDLLEHKKFDLILSDILMPELTGTDLLNIVKEKNIHNDIPFIFISARTDPKDIRVSMGMGADDYITKPFLFEHLLLSVQSRLKRFEELRQKQVIATDFSEEDKQAIELIPTLSKTEAKVLNFLSQGLSSKEIAQKLNITLRTATNHRYNIAKKLKINGNYATMKLAFRLQKT